MDGTIDRACRAFVFAAVAVLVALAASPGVYAQKTDVLKVNYYHNAGGTFPDGTVSIVNPGTTFTDLCANVYVFDTAEELKECCSCKVTPNGLLQLSVRSNLTNNPQNGVFAGLGAIKILSAATVAGLCGQPVAEKPTPIPTLRSWITHPQTPTTISAGVTIPGTSTENEFSDAVLSTGELASLNDLCDSINDNGSGKGLCGLTVPACSPH